MTGEEYQVSIVGGGVTGTALLYTLAEYTDVDSVALFEQHDSVAPAGMPSNSSTNSQTLHAGDIETNYTREKSEHVKEAADLVTGYVENVADTADILHPMQKMVLGVGDDEVEQLVERYDEIEDLYPELELIGRDEIAEREPYLLAGRDAKEELAALYTEKGCAADFGALAESFVEQAEQADADVAVYTGTGVDDILQAGDDYLLSTDAGVVHTDALVIAAGANSLPLAQELGYGEDYTQFPVAGGFYFGPEWLELNGKVYTVQNEKLPFAAVHGDPDIDEDGRVRFGPTAQPVLSPEWNQNTGYLPKALHPSNMDTGIAKGLFNRGAAEALGKLSLDLDVAKFMGKNALYELPWVGEKTFIRDAKKIVPALSASNLEEARGKGGVRPQIIDKQQKELLLGEAKIVDDGLVVNMTPSPGASSCLKNAANDTAHLTEYLDATFDKDRFYDELNTEPV